MFRHTLHQRVRTRADMQLKRVCILYYWIRARKRYFRSIIRSSLEENRQTCFFFGLYFSIDYCRGRRRC